jgi:pimeloyl-ACP methyl ester carboxylesterase
MIPDFRNQQYAWIVVPSGRRRFGYDWMSAQYTTALTSLRALPALLGPSLTADYGVNVDRILFVGHSMGGHGCYHISTHYPDLALGIVCAAGWTRFDEYIPYYTRIGNSFVDPVTSGLLRSSISEDSGDLHVDNIKGVPFMTRLGGDDDDVSPWFPRKMARIYDQISGQSHAATVSEVPGQGHWFDGIFGGDEVQAFFDRYLLPASPVYPELPQTFTITLTHPATFGSRGGIKPLQLIQPYRLSKIRVQRQSNNKWTLHTHNIRRFGFVN